MNRTNEFYLITLLSVIWAATTIKPLRKGWKSLDSSDKQIIFIKISLAVALIATSILIISHG